MDNKKTVMLLVGLIIYALYYKKFRFYIFEQKISFTKGRRNVGKTLPPFPNGWFTVLRSDELKKGETRYIDLHGDHLVVFRGTNNEVYALDAYCAHMGANLGVNGTVVNESCVQCPFHGWQFDGETGNCVVGKDKKPREAIRYEYDLENNYEFKECGKEMVKIKKFEIKELNGLIHVWFHANPEFANKPQYQLFDLTTRLKNLEYRGKSINKINCVLQDITENGGDMMHFHYVHSQVIPYLMTSSWNTNWARADDPDIRTKLAIKDEYLNNYRMRLFDEFLTEENKQYIGILHIDNTLTVLKKYSMSFIVTGFQLGTGLVYLFIKSRFLETVMIHHIHSPEKYRQFIFHELYCDWYTPYWFSGLQLTLEVMQLLYDGEVWDNKKFLQNPLYSTHPNSTDKILIDWRKWYSQFYDGCKEPQSLSW